MTHLALPATAAPSLTRRPRRVAILVGVLGATGALGILLGQAHAADPAVSERALVLLLRFMAVLKAAGALASGALVLWRLGRPLGGGIFATYLAASGLMAAAPGLIWFLGLVAPGALVFHAGLVAFLVCAARDEGLRAPLPRRRG